jgi:hypothetical protein
MERLFYVPIRGSTPLPAEFPAAEAVAFVSADGTRLHGWFIPAAGASAAEPAPGILHVHGNAGNITSHLWFTEYLPGAGFNVFIFDYRGYGQSDGTPRSRRPLIEDTHAALDALLARPEVDRSRIGMYAQSLGGAIGLNVMAERTEIRAAVIESAFSSWRQIAAEAVGGHPPGWFARALAWLLIGDGLRPDDAAARIDRPLLFLHGTADSIIATFHSERLAQAAGGRATLHLLSGGEHNSLRSTHPEVEEIVIDFLRQRLAKPDAPDGDV